MRRWEEIFTEADRNLLEKIGFGQKQAYGSNPALLIIDVTMAFLGSTRQPVLQSVKEYGTSCGEAGWIALDSIQKLLEICRANDIPVIFTVIDTTSCQLCGISAIKRKSTLAELEEQANKIADSITPLSTELVIRKTRASAFFRTPLDVCLQTMGVDSLLVAGTSTSGCVRASVVDAFSHGYKCFVIEECTFDRFELSHLVNLFDMNAKYADVISLEKARKYIIEVGQSKKGSLLKTLALKNQVVP